MKKVGLILEGGGMKGMFTAGVLDYFLEKNLEFETIIGVSAGAIHACSFISKQKYRSRDIALEFMNDKRYFSMRSWRETGDLFNAKFAYYDIPEKYYPFDHKTFNKSKTKLLVGVTDIVKGKAKYLPIKTFANGEIEALRASASLPIVANIVKYRGKKYLDGGLIDQIPIKKMESLGYEKTIIISTKPASWRRKPSKLYLLAKLKYRKYPAIAESIKKRHIVFNETQEYIEAQEKAGKAFVIALGNDIKIKRIDRNIQRLEAAYNHGYEKAKEIYPDLIKFLGSNS